MRNMLKIALEGAFTNFKRIFFAADRVTDMEMRKQISTLSVKPAKKVDEDACIGCGGCANVCPTNAIEMKKLASPVKLTDSWTKTEVPELNSLKCVVCYYCHDFCPVFLLYGEKELSIQILLEIRKWMFQNLLISQLKYLMIN